MAGIIFGLCSLPLQLTSKKWRAMPAQEKAMTEQIQYLTPAWRDEAEKRLKSELSPESR